METGQAKEGRWFVLMLKISSSYLSKEILGIFFNASSQIYFRDVQNYPNMASFMVVCVGVTKCL